MIKPSVVLILFGVCVLLALSFMLIKEDRPAISAPVNAGARLAAGLDAEKVSAIDIKKANVAVRLEKKDKNWLLASHKNRLANTQRVDELLNNTRAAAVEGTRSGSPELFGLDEKGRTEVTFHADANKTTLLFGKSIDFSKSAAKSSESGPIYEIDKELDRNAGIRTDKDERILDPAYFYDLKLFSFNQDDIIDIVIKKGHDVTRVQRTIPGKGTLEPKQEVGKDDPKPVWWITEPDGMAAEESAVNTICSSLAFLNAKSYADEIAEKDRGLDKPSARLKVRLKDGTEYLLAFGKVDNDAVLSVSGRSDPYVVEKYIFESMTRGANELKKKEDEKKDASKTGLNLPPDGEKMNQEQLDAIIKDAQSRGRNVKKPIELPTEAPPPQPKAEAPAMPPLKLEEPKPKLPPAVVKDNTPVIKPEEKPPAKPDEKKPEEKK